MRVRMSWLKLSRPIKTMHHTKEHSEGLHWKHWLYKWRQISTVPTRAVCGRAVCGRPVHNCKRPAQNAKWGDEEVCHCQLKTCRDLWYMATGTAHQHPNHIPIVKDGGGSIMVWGCFAASGPGWIAVADRKINSKIYQNSFWENLRPGWCSRTTTQMINLIANLSSSLSNLKSFTFSTINSQHCVKAIKIHKLLLIVVSRTDSK